MTSARNQAGFTILELMIATTVFSVVLLVCTFGLIQIGNIYYKGGTTARTQGVTRAVMEDISQAIMTGSTEPLPVDVNGQVIESDQNTHAFCIGSNRYIYKLGSRVKTGDLQAHALMVDQSVSPCSATAFPSSGARELLGENMQLTDLSITGDGRSYTIRVKVTHGDDFVSDSTNPAYGNCKGGVGSQFCASSSLETTVQRRLN